MDIKLILKGFIIGIAKIIPGVSGSMLAYSLGIYESIIEAVTNFFSDKRKHFKLLFNFGIGVFLAIILFSKLIIFLLNNYYNYTISLFIGLIIGTIIHFTKCLKINKKNIFIFIIIIILFYILMHLIKRNEYIFSCTFIDYIYTFFLGSIDAFTSIVPGISGTAIFMILGSYKYVLNLLSNPFKINFIIYGLGLIFGIIFTCYLMNYLLKNRKEETNICIFALMLYSIISILLTLNYFNINVFILLIIGIIIGIKLDK